MQTPKVTAGTLTGDAALVALKASAEAVDPVVTRLSEAFLPGEVRGDEAGGSSARETKGELASLPGTSTDIQSILVDLGRAALKVCIGQLQRVKQKQIYFLKALLGRHPRIERSHQTTRRGRAGRSGGEFCQHSVPTRSGRSHKPGFAPPKRSISAWIISAAVV